MITWKYALRLPGELKPILTDKARASGRSVNAEIIHRLNQTDLLQNEIATLKAVIADLTGQSREVAQ